MYRENILLVRVGVVSKIYQSNNGELLVFQVLSHDGCLLYVNFFTKERTKNEKVVGNTDIIQISVKICVTPFGVRFVSFISLSLF